jgi:hypothetical protein
MLGEGQPPEMLLEGWLVRRQLHWVYSDAEAGKTWLALWWAKQVMEQGGVVLWVDEELGAKDIGERLRALGADPEVVTKLFVYEAFPSYTFCEDDLRAWAHELNTLQPELVVFDTATDMLVSAGMDENKGADVTAWVKAFPEVVRSVGATSVVLDHTGKDGQVGKHAVGSRSKRAKAKVQYGLNCEKRYDRTKQGEVTVTLTKNTLGAVLDAKRSFSVGGDGEGNFTWEPIVLTSAMQRHVDGDLDRRNRIVALLRDIQPEALSGNQINDRISGTKAKVSAALAELVDSDLWPVKAKSGTRNATLYSFDLEHALTSESVDAAQNGDELPAGA